MRHILAYSKDHSINENDLCLQGFKVDHSVWLGSSLVGTILRAKCPEGIFFDEAGTINHMEATCGNDGC